MLQFEPPRQTSSPPISFAGSALPHPQLPTFPEKVPLRGPTWSEGAQQTALFPTQWTQRTWEFTELVLNFSFLPFQAPESSIVCKLHLKYHTAAPAGEPLKTGRRKSLPPSSSRPHLLPVPSRTAQGRGGGEGATTQRPGSISQLTRLTGAWVEGP